MAKSPTHALRILLDECKKNRSDKDKQWKGYLDYLIGDQLMKKPVYKSNTVTNYVWAQVQTIAAIISSRIPEIATKAENQAMKSTGDELARVFRRTFKRNQFDQKSLKSIMDMLTFGKGYQKLTWDPWIAGGLGDMKYEWKDTRSIFLEPGMENVYTCNYMFEVNRVNKLALIRQFPKKRDVINRIFFKERSGQETTALEVDEAYQHHLIAASGETPSERTSREAYIYEMANAKGFSDDTVEVVEAWFFDERTRDDIQSIIEGKKIITKDGDSQAYPKGHIIVFAGGEILDDRPNRFPMYPYFEINNYVVPTGGKDNISGYGFSEIEQIKGLQRQYNIRNNQIFDILNYCIGRQKLYDHTSGIDTDKLTNAPNAWIECTNVNGVKELEANQPSAALFQSLSDIKLSIEEVTRVREVSQGTVPGDVRSGYAIEELKESAQIGLRMKSSSIEASVLKMAEYMTLMVRDFYIPGIHYNHEYNLNEIWPEDFEFEVKAGVHLPASRFAEQQLMQWMFANKIIDEEYVIGQSNLEGKDELIERMKPIWSQRQQVELQMMQQALNPPPQAETSGGY